MALTVFTGASQTNAVESALPADWCIAGEKALAAGHHDSAFFFFSKAYLAGMSEDSLYYFLSEYYRTKSALDSALALNYAIKNRTDGKFVQAQYLQRYRIFSTLGWSAESRTMMDSLETVGYHRLFNLIPELALQAGIGYKYEPRWIDTTFFWGAADDPDGHTTYQGEFHALNTTLRWNLPQIRGRRLSTGIRAGASKPYYAGRSPWETDSTFLTGGVFARVNDLWKGVGIEYNARLKRYFSDDVAINNSIEMSFIKARAQRVGAIMAGYDREDDLSSRSVRHFIWGVTSLQASDRWTFSLSGSGYLTDATPIAIPQPVLVIFLDQLQKALPDLYSDSTFTVRLTPDTIRLDTMTISQRLTIGPATANALNNTLAASLQADTVILMKKIPSRFISLNPMVQHSRPLPFKLNAAIDCGWRVDYYPERYEWDEMPFTTLSADKRYYLGFNRSDTAYYGLSAAPTTQFANGVLTLVSRPTTALKPTSARRIDNTATLNLSLEREFKAAGAIRLAGAVAKTWSTLSDRVPIAIPDWSWSVALTWRVTFSPRQNFPD
jgi:hypothetical protein